jgi:hypothetical protein
LVALASDLTLSLSESILLFALKFEETGSSSEAMTSSPYFDLIFAARFGWMYSSMG